MRTCKHVDKLPVLNFDSIIGEGHKRQRKHSNLLPNSVRGIICGPSNCGKSNVMFSLLFDENGIKFENVYVYSKSLYQPKYKFLERVLSEISGIKYFPFHNNQNIESPQKARKNSVFIFDDVSCEKQAIIRDYFSMGRHAGIDSFYLCQSYSKIPKQLIRDNANLIIIFKQDDLNLKHIYSDHVGSDMSFEKFKKICSNCWTNKYEFLVIDKDSDNNNGRYRLNFDVFINV